jgi:alanyl-tRNA synthetase
LDINETPGLVAGYKEIRSTNPKSIDDRLAFKLYDTFGLDEESISGLAQVLGLPFNVSGLYKQLELAKIKSKQPVLSATDVHHQLNRSKIPKTDRSDLYSCTKTQDNKYVFEELPVRILKIVKNSAFVSEVGPESFCSLLLDKSNLYTEAGGQMSDRGTILFDGDVFEITEAQDWNGYVLHKGFLHSGKDHRLGVGASGVLRIDPEFRLKNMRNHTAVHLLNSAIKRLKGATCQKSSKVTQNYLNLDVGVFGEKLSPDEVGTIENTIKKLIRSDLPVKIDVLDSQQLASLDNVTLIPGEVYPESGIRIVEVEGPEGFLSREPCCGTHVLNTGDIGDFCVISCKSLGRGTASVHAVTGDRAKLAKSNGIELLNNLETLEKSVKDNIDKVMRVKGGKVGRRLRLRLFLLAARSFESGHFRVQTTLELQRRRRDDPVGRRETAVHRHLEQDHQRDQRLGQEEFEVILVNVFCCLSLTDDFQRVYRNRDAQRPRIEPFGNEEQPEVHGALPEEFAGLGERLVAESDEILLGHSGHHHFVRGQHGQGALLRSRSKSLISGTVERK